jgi:hypothetical protein
MKKIILLFTILFIGLNIFATEATDTDWYVDIDGGTYFTPLGSKPYFNVEAIYEEGIFRFGGEADIKIKDWGIEEAGIFGKVGIFGKLANIYGEIGVGIGFVSNINSTDLKYKPEAKLLIDMGDYIIQAKIGILIKDNFDKDSAYISIGVQKRFFKELKD